MQFGCGCDSESERLRYTQLHTHGKNCNLLVRQLLIANAQLKTFYPTTYVSVLHLACIAARPRAFTG
jgi:hypothetical protein